MYDNLRDAEFRLRNTVVWYGDKYRYVSGVLKSEGNILLKLHGVGSVKLTDDKLKVRSIPTGYIRIDKNTYYLTRLPARRYRQGLRDDNCVLFSGDRKVNLTDHFITPCIVGYNTPKTKHTILSKDFLLECNGEGKPKAILYRTKLVGYYLNGEARFINGLDFIKESFEKAMGEYRD